MIALAAQVAMSLVLVGMGPDYAGAVDKDTVKVHGDIASADLVTITANPEGGEGLGRVAVSHMSFNCKRKLMTLTGGFSQSQSGDELKPVETHDWTAVPPNSPAWNTFEYACISRTPQPPRTFKTFKAFQAFYDGALARAPKPQPAKP